MQLELLGKKLDNIAAWNYSAKAAIDIAMHDLICKRLGIPLYKYFGITPRTDLATSFTISISDPDTMKKADRAGAGISCLQGQSRSSGRYRNGGGGSRRH